MDTGLSNAEVALMASRDANGGYGGGLLWFFALLLIAGGNWGMNGGGNNATTNLYEGLASQTTHAELGNLAMQIANGNYATLNAINDQTSAMLQQNNTNLVNAIQGFNTVNQNITTQGNNISSQIAALSAQMSSCCCEIKTQMLQDKLDATQAQLVIAQNNANNAQQTQYLLSQMGRWVANPAEAAAGA